MARDDDSTSTIVPSPQRLTLRSHKIRVEVLQGPQEGAIIELPGPEARIGKGEDCDFRIDDRTVSRHHLTLRIEHNRIRVIDAGSHNGTTVDGVRIRDAYARADSCIALGKTTLKLCMVKSIVELPLSPNDHFGGMLGKSVAMRRAFTMLERAANTDAPVLIEGETGTGKEVAARAIHDASPRASAPFVVLDCSTITPGLAESEILGHSSNSFNGAKERMGLFEEADGGTVFLDEIGELPPPLQPKLLRVLENMEVRRVGANRARPIDVRIIAATNRQLARAVDLGAFREDLYYRLAVLKVRLPPLSERREDVPLLVRHFEKQLMPRMRAKAPLPQEQVEALAHEPWPGNIRELRNEVARLLALGIGTNVTAEERSELDAERLGVHLDEPLLDGRDRVADAYVKSYIKLALQKTNGNISRAAELAKVGRKFFQTAMKRFGLRGDFEDWERETTSV